MPKSLVAKVVSISSDGLIVVLSLPAQADTENARVVFDSFQTPLMQDPSGLLHSRSAGDRITLRFPKGNISASSRFAINQQPGIVIEGAGKWHTNILSIEGCAYSGIIVTSSPGGQIKNMSGRGFNTPTTHNGSSNNNAVFTFDNSSDSKLTDVVTIESTAGTGFGNYSSGGTAEYVETYNYGDRMYYQWYGGGADSSNILYKLCKIVSTKLSTGYEPFRMDNAKFLRCFGVNIISSNNSCGMTAYKKYQVCNDAYILQNEYLNIANNPMLNCNTNTGYSNEGNGTVLEDVMLAQLGPVGLKTNYGSSIPESGSLAILPGVNMSGITKDN